MTILTNRKLLSDVALSLEINETVPKEILANILATQSLKTLGEKLKKVDDSLSNNNISRRGKLKLIHALIQDHNLSPNEHKKRVNILASKELMSTNCTEQELPFIGGKDKGLKELERHQVALGYKVPFYKVVEGEPSQEYRNELAIKFNGKKAIVRSNSLLEDGEHKFSGRYDSIVVDHPNWKSLKSAYEKVMESLHSKKAVAYRKEHNLGEDTMYVIVQEFIDGEWYGSINTSIPEYPYDMEISFSREWGAVTDNKNEEGIYQIDMGKDSSRHETFISENAKGKGHKETLIDLSTTKLHEVSIALETKYGPSQIEFVIKNGELYLVQKRPIKIVENLRVCEIPNYPTDRQLPSPNIARGIEPIINLPILQTVGICSLTRRNLDAMDRPGIGNMFGMFGAKEQEKQMRDWHVERVNEIVEFNKKNTDGYILVVDKFDETMMDHLNLIINRGDNKYPQFRDITFDQLTSNKKAVVVTEYGDYTMAHIQDLIREKHIAYLGYESCGTYDSMKKQIKGGDRGSIYFEGKKGHFFLEARENVGLAKSFGSKLSLVDHSKYNDPYPNMHVEMPYDKGIDLFYEGFIQLVTEITGEEWTFIQDESSIGGVLRNKENEIIMLRGIKSGSYFELSVENHVPGRDINNYVSTEGGISVSKELIDNIFKKMEEQFTYKPSSY